MPGKPITSLVAAALACFAAAQLAAEDTPRWISLDSGGQCELRHVSDGGEMLTLALRGDGTYIISGTAISRTDSDAASDRVLARAGGREVLLSGAAGDLRAQSERSGEHPLSLFIAAARGEDGVTIVSGDEERTLALAGFAPRADEFEACARALRLGEGPRGPVNLGFDGLRQLAEVASRQRLLTEVIGYRLAVDAEGRPTDCTLDRDFRRRIVTIQLCRVLVGHHRFEPARDAAGKPIAGSYSSRIDFRTWMGQDGYLEREGHD